MCGKLCINIYIYIIIIYKKQIEWPLQAFEHKLIYPKLEYTQNGQRISPTNEVKRKWVQCVGLNALPSSLPFLIAYLRSREFGSPETHLWLLFSCISVFPFVFTETENGNEVRHWPNNFCT